MTLQQDAQAWTIRDLMKFSISHLERHGFGEARLTVELLLAHALQCERIELYTNFEKPLSRDELKVFRGYYERRLAHEPVQYIVGSTSFMGLPLSIDDRVFIPRPETETLVEQVMILCQGRTQGQLTSILEIGTGSGNIAVTLAKLVPGVRMTTLDTSAEALEVAHSNAVKHGVEEKITFSRKDVFQSIEKEFAEPFDILLSNPPYVSKEEWENLDPEVRKYEPQNAVSDLKDGLSFYRRLGTLAHSLLRENGYLVVEVGDGQSGIVRSLFADARLTEIQVVRDLQEKERVVIGKWPGIQKQ
jgi:release factor glutamine methyltransferase